MIDIFRPWILGVVVALAACSSTETHATDPAEPAQAENQALTQRRIQTDDDCIIVLRPHANQPGPNLLVTETGSTATTRTYTLQLDAAVSGTLKLYGADQTDFKEIAFPHQYVLRLTDHSTHITAQVTGHGSPWSEDLLPTFTSGVRRPRATLHRLTRRRDELDVYFGQDIATVRFWLD